MNPAQLLLDFGKSVLSRFVDSPPNPSAASAATPVRGVQRDIPLEELSHRLLEGVGWDNPKVRVQWNARLRTTAGLACWTSRTISLNPRLMEISAAEVQRTLRHELAHFLAQSRAGRRRIAAHGPEWRQACCDLDIPRESRCHDLPFGGSRRKPKHFYACPKCGTTLKRVRPIRRSLACLNCCRVHSRGHYDARFRFLPVAAPEPHPAAA
jgi:SprT protein